MKRKGTAYPGVYLVGPGKYSIWFYVGRDRIWDTISASSDKEAKDIRQKRRLEAKVKPISSAVQVNASASLNAVLQEILGATKAEGRSEKLRGKYKNVFNRLFYEFPKEMGIKIQSPGQLNLAYLERYKVWYANSKKRIKGVGSEMIMVKALIRRMRRLGFVERAMMEDLAEFKIPHRDGDESYPSISVSKLRDLFTYIRNDNEQLYDFFMFLLITGRRPVEASLIERKDIEWAGLNIPARINVRSETTKMRVPAPLDIHPVGDVDLIALILRSKNRSVAVPSPYLFTNKRGKKISHSPARNYLIKASTAILGQKVNMKFFRKRYATECGKNKVPPKDAMRRSGHKSINVFIKHYQQTTEEGLASVINAVTI